MAKLHYKRVKAEIMAIDEVPSEWRAQVQKMLDADTEKTE